MRGASLVRVNGGALQAVDLLRTLDVPRSFRTLTLLGGPISTGAATATFPAEPGPTGRPVMRGTRNAYASGWGGYMGGYLSRVIPQHHVATLTFWARANRTGFPFYMQFANDPATVHFSTPRMLASLSTVWQKYTVPVATSHHWPADYAYKARFAIVDDTGGIAAGDWIEISDMRVTEPALASTAIVDDFERGTAAIGGTGPAPGWVGSSFVTQSGYARVSSAAGSGTYLATLDMADTDHEVFVDLIRNGSTSAGVVARFADSNNYCGARYTASGQLGFFTQIGGVTSVVQESIRTGVSTSALVRIGLRVIGSTVNVLHNGETAYTGTVPSSLLTGTAVGLRATHAASNALYDNFSAMTL